MIPRAFIRRLYSRVTEIALVANDDDRRRATWVAELDQLLVNESDQVEAFLARNVVYKDEGMGSDDKLWGYRRVRRLVDKL